MSIEINGATFLRYAEKTMEAIEMVPENRRIDRLWQMDIVTPDGNTEGLQAMTAPEMAADIVGSFKFIVDFCLHEFPLTPENIVLMQTENKLLSQMPMTEIARIGRERSQFVATLFDTISDAELDVVITQRQHSTTVRQYLIFLFSHMIHHRGQLFTMLRTMGCKPPRFMG